MARSLLSTRRNVPSRHAAAYGSAWRRLVAAVHAAGGRAWLFRRTSVTGEYLEFIEFRGSPSLPEQGAVAAASRALEELAPGTVEEWEEADPG